METLDFKKYAKCLVFGSINISIENFVSLVVSILDADNKELLHPKELELQKQMRTSTLLRKPKKIGRNKPNNRDMVFIVGGNCGMGIKSLNYYHSIFDKVNKILSKHNSHILFVRGNNDNPAFFYEDKLGFSNIKCIKDYTVVEMKNYNILCIGGAISMDRQWKISQEKRTNKPLYFKDENVKYNEALLDEIISKYDIGCLITCASPTFTYPSSSIIDKSKWLANDTELLEDIKTERNIMDKIYSKLIEHNKKPFIWFYGKYNYSQHNKINDILFASLANSTYASINSLLRDYFNLSFEPNQKNIINQSAKMDFASTFETRYDINYNPIIENRFDEEDMLIGDEEDAPNIPNEEIMHPFDAPDIQNGRMIYDGVPNVQVNEAVMHLDLHAPHEIIGF